MSELDIKQYNDIKKLIDTYKQVVSDIKVVFQSNENEKNNSFASYQFPTDNYDENIYEVLKEFAQLDYEINKRNNNIVEDITNFKFYDVKNNIPIGLYNFHHSTEFLDNINNKTMSL